MNDVLEGDENLRSPFKFNVKYNKIKHTTQRENRKY